MRLEHGSLIMVGHNKIPCINAMGGFLGGGPGILFKAYHCCITLRMIEHTASTWMYMKQVRMCVLLNTHFKLLITS